MNGGKRALITGITGQDGSYLAEFLLKKGYQVFGLVRRLSVDPLSRIEKLSLNRKIKIIYGDIRDLSSIIKVLDESKPDEIYNLASQSHVGLSFDLEEETMEINYYMVDKLVREATKRNPKVRIYQASSSEMFGNPSSSPQNELTKFNPISPYAKSKVKAYEDVIIKMRDKNNFFLCSGILFNHESPRRGKQFVTKKITHSMCKIKLGLQDCFELGNIDVKKDWGYAKDYVEAMWLMLQQKKPQDFVIATGKNYSVRDFINRVAYELDMPITWCGKGLGEFAKDSNGRIIIKINPEYYRPHDVINVIGDPTKARKILGWKSKVSFNGLVKIMVKSDLDELKKFL